MEEALCSRMSARAPTLGHVRYVVIPGVFLTSCHLRSQYSVSNLSRRELEGIQQLLDFCRSPHSARCIEVKGLTFGVLILDSVSLILRLDLCPR